MGDDSLSSLPGATGVSVRVTASRWLALLLLVAPFAIFVNASPSWAWAIPFIVILTVSVAKTAPDLRVHALFFGLLAALLAAAVPWPLPFALPVLLVVTLRSRSAAVRDATTWLRGGKLDPGTLLFAAGVAVVSSVALVLWFTYGNADVSDIVAMVPPSSVPTLVAIAVVFSVANALWEEFLLKGMAWDALTRLMNNRWLINVSQAVLFGLMHYHGFPRGITGVILAAIYGFLLGVIRDRSGGMTLVVATHILADLTICALVFSRVES